MITCLIIGGALVFSLALTLFFCQMFPKEDLPPPDEKAIRRNYEDML